jgi:hypothetical protein
VGNTFVLLTMTWLAGQDIEVITVPQTPASNQVRSATLGDPVTAPEPAGGEERGRGWKLRGPFARGNNDDSSERPRFFQRMKKSISGLFQRGDNANSQEGNTGNTGQANATAVKASSIPVAQPAPRGPAIKLSEPPLAEPVSKSASSSVAPISFHAAPSSRKDLSPKMAEKVGHETDYSWITGQVRQQNGRWIIHYATSDTVDRYSGHLPIDAPAEQTKNLRDGDLVCVHGQVSTGANAVYQATTVNVVEHESN